MGIAEQHAEKVRRDILANDRRDMPGLVRVSFGIYNTFSEIDVLVEALSRIVAGQYEGRYLQDKISGEYHPQDWHYNSEAYFRL